MGKKIPFDIAEKIVRINANDSIFTTGNCYGYKININHSKIRPLYERYKKKIGERILSDQQRHDFERIIFKMIERKGEINNE